MRGGGGGVRGDRTRRGGEDGERDELKRGDRGLARRVKGGRVGGIE